MTDFTLYSEFKPTGDQPEAIEGLVRGIKEGIRHQTLLGATGTGKTFVMANIVAQLNRPTLILAHNKTLAAQLYSEFKAFFPDNAVEYFVSYYDYYQPEAYIPSRDLFIEKDTSINEEIERLRLAATAALMSRRDVLIVASVSSIYGIGDPTTWASSRLDLHRGMTIRRNAILRHLTRIQYSRNDMELNLGKYRVRGDTIEVMPGYANTIYRIQMWGDDIERLTEIDQITGEVLYEHEAITLFPAKQFIAEGDVMQKAISDIEQELDERIKFYKEKGMAVEGQRIEQRTRYDLEMLREVGHCAGIENYSRHIDQRPEGSAPWTLIDYFPDDYLLFIDESHMTIPQIRGMWRGDRSRKETLVDYGFRLPSALDNRPLNFMEFESRVRNVVFTSATPGPYEIEKSEQVVEQIIRPTGLIDPEVEVRPIEGQIDDLMKEIHDRIEVGQRALVTTLTKRMSEKLAEFLMEAGVKVHYLHSEIDTIERIEILRDLRLGVYDVVVGINLLREGLDLPEVSLVAILDADKQGFLRSETALIQTIGRAARHIDGRVIMYADKMTDAMKAAIDETNRRREKQMRHNEENGIEPRSILKSIRDLTERVKVKEEEYEGQRKPGSPGHGDIPERELEALVRELEKQMKAAAEQLEFEKAAMLRDQVFELRELLILKQTGKKDLPIWEQDRILPVDDEESYEE